MRTNFYSAPCAVCDAAVGAMGVFKIRRDASGSSWFGPFCPTHRPVPVETETIETMAECLDRTIDFLVSPEGIMVEEDVVRPAVQQAVDEWRRNEKGGAWKRI